MKVRQTKIKKQPVKMMEFTGLTDLTKFLESTSPDAGWDDHLTMELRPSWCGAHSYQEARGDLFKGKNVAEIKKAVARGGFTGEKQKRVLGVIGGAPCVPAYLAGSPACMYRVDKVKSRGAYNVYVDVGVHCGITAAQVRDAGIEILIRVLKLSAKYPVNLYVGVLGEHGRKILGSAVKIMDAGKAFNVARVSFALTEPAFLRVFGLAVIERNGGFWGTPARMGYGRPLAEHERKAVCDQIFKNAIVLSTSAVIRDSRHAFDAIDAVLK